MATPDQESIVTFMSITGSSELVAVQKLTEHGANLNQAVNAHFTEGDANIRHETDVAAPQEDLMDIDEPTEVATHRPPFSLIDPNSNRHIIDSGQGAEPVDSAPRIEDATETLPESVPEARGIWSIDDEHNDDFPSLRSSDSAGLNGPSEGVLGGTSHGTHLSPSAPQLDDLPDYSIEEQMIQAAIEASRHDTEITRPDDAVQDPELANVVSVSLKTAEQEKALRQLESEAGPSGTASKLAEVEEVAALASSDGRLDVGGSSIQDETEDADEHPLVRHRSRHTPSNSIDTANNTGEVDLISSAGPPQQENVNHVVNGEDNFPSDEWGGISSMEHDEAVMLEAALFGGIPEGSGYRVPRGFMENGLDRTSGPYTRRTPRPPSPSLTAQRLIREQQDDEYLASLQADREKELQEQAAREAAMEEEKRKEEEAQRKLEEDQEIERQLAAKEASLPQEPTSDDENSINLLVRMPDGSRRGRRFLKTDKLQCLFDFIDVGRVVKPTAYRLVRPYPRRAFSDGESELTLNELGLTSKQEALFLELI